MDRAEESVLFREVSCVSEVEMYILLAGESVLFREVSLVEGVIMGNDHTCYA